MNTKLLTLLSCAGLTINTVNPAKAQDLIEDDVNLVRRYIVEIEPLDSIILENLVNGCCHNGSCTCNASCK